MKKRLLNKDNRKPKKKDIWTSDTTRQFLRNITEEKIDEKRGRDQNEVI